MKILLRASIVLLLSLLIIVLSAILALAIGADLNALYSSEEFLRFLAVLSGAGVIGFLLLKKTDPGNKILEKAKLENSFWLSLNKLKHLREFSVLRYRDLSKHSSGIVIGASKHRKDVEVVCTSQLHALIVGTTGSGKTTGFIDQNIASLSSFSDSPSLVITDPKKELYSKHATSLKKRGYKVYALDLRSPFMSCHWNPLDSIKEKAKKVSLIEKNLDCLYGRYTAGDEVFGSYAEAMARAKELRSEINDSARDLVYALCPIENKEQPVWEQGARNLILGMVVAFAEDYMEGKVTEEQFTLRSLYSNISKYCNEERIDELKDYLLSCRPSLSLIRGMVSTVLVTKDKTLTSYLTDVHRYIEQFSDEGITHLSDKSGLDFKQFDEDKTALFVIIPDEKATRHKFASLLLSQCYKALVEKAAENEKKGIEKTAQLKRKTYFVLDEFGNLPKNEQIESIVTVSRSRRIALIMAIQSFSQLSARYGIDLAEIIKNNCNVKVFIGTDDYKTRKEFSELCGEMKIKHESANYSEKKVSSGVSAMTRPLLTTGMLERLNGNEKGHAIVSVRGYNPIHSIFTPSFKLKRLYFPCGEDAEESATPEIVSPNIYDIAEAGFEKEYMEEIKRLDEENIAEDLKPTLENDIRAKVTMLEGLIPSEHFQKLLELEPEDIPLYLRELKDNFSAHIALRLEMTARAIEAILEKIKYASN